MTTLNMMDGVRTQTLRVRLTGVRRYKLRVWVGLRLLKLAISVIGMKGVISFDDA